MFSLLQALEYAGGIYYPRGGFTRVAQALEEAALTRTESLYLLWKLCIIIMKVSRIFHPPRIRVATLYSALWFHCLTLATISRCFYFCMYPFYDKSNAFLIQYNRILLAQTPHKYGAIIAAKADYLLITRHKGDVRYGT